MNCDNALRRFDFVAPTIELTFNEERRQGTACGGMCSVVGVLIVLYYIASSASRINSMAEYEVTSSQQATYFKYLPDAANNYTFPAVTFGFYTPNDTVDPKEYITSVFEMKFWPATDSD